MNTMTPKRKKWDDLTADEKVARIEVYRASMTRQGPDPDVRSMADFFKAEKRRKRRRLHIVTAILAMRKNTIVDR